MQLNLLQCFAVIIMAFILAISMICAVMRNNYVISIAQFKGILVVFGFCLIVFVAFFEPNRVIRWDLLVHYEEVNKLRGHDFSYALQYCGYSVYYIATVYFWLISRLPDNTLLPVFPMIIDFLIFMYIFSDRFTHENEGVSHVSFSQAFFVFFSWLTTFGLKLAVSGLRCVTACAFASLAVYLFCKKAKHIFVVILFIATAALIHSYSLIVIPVVLLSKTKNKTPIICVMFAVYFFWAWTLETLYNVLPANFLYIRVLLARVMRYWNTYSMISVYRGSGLGMALLYICMVVYAVLLWFATKEYQKSICSKDETVRNIIEYTQTLLLFTIGMSFNYLYVERTMYLIAYSSIMLFTINERKCALNHLLKLLFICLQLYIFYSNDIGTFIANYTR